MDDYEQKYKKALGWMQSLYNGLHGATKEDAEHYFPELAESEDERIKKALVRFHKSTIDIDGIKGADILAWLEKQGSQQPTIIWHSVSEEPEEMKELFCEWESDDATWHDVAFYNEESKTFRHAKMSINVTKWVYVDELLERQGEQKSINKVDPKFKIGDYVKNVNDKREPVYEIVYMDKECYICEYRGKERMGDKAVMHFAFDNPYLRLVEPKFKVGDWIYHEISGNAFHINRIENRTYISDEGATISFGRQNDWRLWTIEDAKDGDVLADGNLPFIFKKIDANKYSYAYCGISVDDDFKIESDGESGEWTWTQDIKPATVEQRDILFQKMKEAGYEWDAKKKELKRIKQEPTESPKDYHSIDPHFGISVEDLMTKKNTADNKVEPKFKVKYAGNEYNVLETKDIAGITFYVIEDEHNHIDYVKAKNCEIISGYTIKENGSPYPTKHAKFFEQKPAELSKEDEDIIEWLIGYLEYQIMNSIVTEEKFNCLDAISTLKSLKEKVLIHPKQEWNEEDIKMIERIACILDGIRYYNTVDNKQEKSYQSEIDFLKSLKDKVQPQSQWKPSDEQIEAVRLAAEIGTANSSWAMGILKSMYQDLKKLRGE